MTTKAMKLLLKCFSNPCGFKPYVNRENEIIFCDRPNTYFRLGDINTELDFQCKVLEWLSFLTADNHWYWPKTGRNMEKLINYLLDTNFTHEDYQYIYVHLGNRVNHDLTIRFIKSGYNIELLKEKK